MGGTLGAGDAHRTHRADAPVTVRTATCASGGVRMAAAPGPVPAGVDGAGIAAGAGGGGADRVGLGAASSTAMAAALTWKAVLREKRSAMAPSRPIST